MQINCAVMSLQVTEQLRNFVAAMAVETRIRQIADHRKFRGNWQLKILWEGFEDNEATWQGLKELHSDPPDLVKRYVRFVQDKEVQDEMRKVKASLG
jgi:hypothetical protein